MSSVPQQVHSFPSRPYVNTIGHHSKLATTNLGGGRDNRLERERVAHTLQTGSSNNPLNSISDEQREEINEAFSLFDLDKDQRIDYHEFKVALKALGFDLPKSSILNLLTAHGTPPSNQAAGGGGGGLGKSTNNNQLSPARNLLSLPAFQNIAAKLIVERDPREEILRAFALFDIDGKDMITLDDLRRVARELGEGLEEEEMVAMIEEFDREGRGGVARDEFIDICMG